MDGRRRLHSSVPGDEHPGVATSVNNLAWLPRARGDCAAEAPCRQAVGIARRALPQGHWNSGLFVANYGKCLVKLERYAEAEAALLEAHMILETALGADHERTIKVIKSLIDLYDAWGQPERADEYRALLPQPEPATQPATQPASRPGSTEATAAEAEE